MKVNASEFLLNHPYEKAKSVGATSCRGTSFDAAVFSRYIMYIFDEYDRQTDRITVALDNNLHSDDRRKFLLCVPWLTMHVGLTAAAVYFLLK